MTIQEILANPAFDKVLETLCVDTERDRNIDANRKAYDGKHSILEDPSRTPRTIGSGETARVVEYTTEILPFQKCIVNSAVTFLFGAPVSLNLSEGDETAFNLIKDAWKKNKLDNLNKTIARDLFVECKIAELWAIPGQVPGQTEYTKRMRVSVLNKRTGYYIYPHFDEFGDMDAFTVKYTVNDSAGKAEEHVDIYTADQIVQSSRSGGTAWQVKSRLNMLGKIPVVYYEQDEPEWEGVKTQIERLEYLDSNFADTNDYNGSPIIEVKGVVTDMPKKEQTGKVIVVSPSEDANGQVTYPGGVRFVSWEQAPESIKLERENLKDTIYGMTQMPDLSFSNVKGMSAVSGIALRLMFADALNKAKNKQETFGPAMDRRLSIMKSMLGLINKTNEAALNALDIDVIFNDVLPQDIKTLIEALSVARGGEAIMSEESAVRMNPLVTDAEKDIEALGGEKSALRSFAESYQP